MPHSPEFERLRDTLQAQYRVEAEIGRGGMGVVVRARDLRLDRSVAIKTLPAHLAADPLIRERFLREARTAASLSHPNIVPIHHADEVGEVVFFVMGLVEGGSVAQHMGRGTFDAATAIQVLSDVAAALGYAHDRGVIHRDIKAENILLDATTGRAMVTDFGIARLAESSPMTATGTILGTVHYMSPEQVRGQRLDGRSDLYSLGVLAFHMLSARFPFEHEAPSAVLVAHVMSDAPPLRSLAPHVPEPLAAVVDRLLHREAVARYDTAAHAVAALQAAREALGAEGAVAPPRVLSSAEANAVWERAALLQQYTGRVAPPPLPAVERPAGAAATSGYKLDDVREAAADVGIDGRYVDRALAERAVTPQVPGVVRPGPLMDAPVSRFLGSRTRLEYEAVVEGELSEDEVAEVVEELRRTLGEFGNVSTVGRTVTFTSQVMSSTHGTPRKLQVSLTSRGGRTTLRAYEDLKQEANALVWGMTGGIGGGFGAALTGAVMAATHGALAPLIPVFFLGVGGAAWASSRYLLKRTVARKDGEIRASMERVAETVRELVAARRPRLPGPPRRA